MSGASNRPITTNTSIDRSNVTDGASHLIVPGNALRTWVTIENPVDPTLNPTGASLFVNEGAAAAADGHSFEVTPSGYYPPIGRPLYLGDIYVLGVSGIKFTVKEYQ